MAKTPLEVPITPNQYALLQAINEQLERVKENYKIAIQAILAAHDTGGRYVGLRKNTIILELEDNGLSTVGTE